MIFDLDEISANLRSNLPIQMISNVRPKNMRFSNPDELLVTYDSKKIQHDLSQRNLRTQTPDRQEFEFSIPMNRDPSKHSHLDDSKNMRSP